MSEVASEIYCRFLLTKRHGYPLWVPEPRSNLHRGYQVTIGDVGIVTNGTFEPLFNICASLDDPVNAGGVPLPFKPLVLGSADIGEWDNYHNPGADIASTNIHKTITSIHLPPGQNM